MGEIGFHMKYINWRVKVKQVFSLIIKVLVWSPYQCEEATYISFSNGSGLHYVLLHEL